MEFFTGEALAALLALTALEIVLGIDNIIFIAILSNKLPAHRRQAARRWGLFGAMGIRVAMLLGLTWIMGLTQTVFSLMNHDFSWRDIILIVGGGILMVKSIREIYEKVEGGHDKQSSTGTAASFAAVIANIMVLDIVFSIDSVITAVGMAKDVWVMITAVVIAVGIMMIAATPVSNFIDRHPALKILALSFLILIGFVLFMEGFGQHVEKGFIYAAMAFAFVVDLLQMRFSSNARKAKALQEEKEEEQKRKSEGSEE